MISFPWTLQRYLTREMTKTFVLAAVALTGVLGLGGSLLNMIKLGDVTPGQLLRLMALVLPLAAAFTLPVAALFSATSTYGRFSADNEFVACRAGGINLHILFLPTLLLALLAGSVSFAVTNFLVPGIIRNLEEFIRTDITALIRQRLHHPRGIALAPGGGASGAYRLRADGVATDPADPNRIALHGITFVEVDGERWVRYGTAREVLLVFEQDASSSYVFGSLSGLSYFDRNLGHFFEESQRVIPPNPIDILALQKIKFLNFFELLQYLARPADWPEVREAIERLRVAETGHVFYQTLWEEWRNDRTVTLSDGRTTYLVRALAAAPPDRGGLDLTDVHVEERMSHRRGRRAVAERAVIEVARCKTLDECGVRINLYNARLSDGETTIARTRETFGPLPLPLDLIDRMDALTDEALLAVPPNSDEDSLAKLRADAGMKHGATVRRLLGAIHERTTFSVSVFVLVILGAALGIAFRGGHVLTAFGISFVPLLAVLVGIMAGKQMSYNVGTHAVGLAVMWSGIVLVAVLDVWILTRVVRR